MSVIPFRRELRFEYGVVEHVAPLIRRVIARNPGPFTFHGTGTYIIGQGEVAIIDPGPDLPEHVDALLAAIRGETITHLLVTHSHRDHSPACRLLQQLCDAPSYAFGPHGSGRDDSGAAVEEGGDREFQPDRIVRDGAIIEGNGWSMECVYTPGHTSNHLCFQLRETKTLFSGDHVMGWSTSVIVPPDGDMGAYLASLDKLLQRDDVVYWPTHGPSIDEPKPLVKALIQHRREREQQILQCLQQGLQQIDAMIPRMYSDLPERMYPAAARSTLAALIHLQQLGQVSCDGLAQLDSRYELA
jgi:glyoxylase-like metal-dependent hydrolase (beta-lactamase superfamily II)